MYNESSVCEMLYCEFQGNEASGSGGAVYSESSILGALECEFRSNTAFESGGALYSVGAVLTIEQSSITGNIAVNGAGMYNYSCSSLSVVDTVFLVNGNGDNAGFAAYNHASSSRFINVLMAGHPYIPVFNNDAVSEMIHCTIALNDNGALYNTNGSAVSIVNSVICVNTGGEKELIDTDDESDTPTFYGDSDDYEVYQVYNDDDESSADVRYSCIYETDDRYYESGLGNIKQVQSFDISDGYKMAREFDMWYYDSEGNWYIDETSTECEDRGGPEIDTDVATIISGKYSIKDSPDLTGSDTYPDLGYHSD